MVAQDEIMALRHDVAFPGDIVAVLLRIVILHQGLAVDVDLAGIDPYRIARNADDPLDVGLAAVERIPEDHHIAVLNVAQAKVIRELVDEDAFLIRQRGHHAGAFDLDRLINKHYQDDRDQDGKGQVPHPGEGIP